MEPFRGRSGLAENDRLTAENRYETAAQSYFAAGRQVPAGRIPGFNRDTVFG